MSDGQKMRYYSNDDSLVALARSYEKMAEHSAAEAAALRAEVEAHKRSRQIDANEARSREQELRAEVERWQNKWASRPLSVEDTEALERRNDELEAEVERLRMAEAEAMAVVYSLEGTVERLREALGMAEVQQHEVAKALRLDPTGDSVYVHYQIMAVIDALRASFPTGESLK